MYELLQAQGHLGPWPKEAQQGLLQRMAATTLCTCAWTSAP